MNNPVPWTVTYEDSQGLVTVANVTAHITVNAQPEELSNNFGFEGGRVLSMVRGHHATTAVTFQREDYDK